MRQDNLKKVDLKAFLIPFAILVIAMVVAAYINIKKHTEKVYTTIEGYTLELAERYTRRISQSKEAASIITRLLDEKLLATGEILMQLGPKIKTEDLVLLAKKYAVDEINVYNEAGEVINSSSASLIGWEPYEGHPVHTFMLSEQSLFTEEIRQNAVSGLSYKYAYVKGEDRSVVQIGISAERIENFFDMFEIQKLIDDFIRNELVENVFFTDSEYKLVAAGSPEYAGITFGYEDIHEHFMLDEPRVGKEFADKGLLHVCAPVFFDGERFGTLTVVWSSEVLTSEINRIIVENVYWSLIVSLLLGGVLFYAYRKRKFSVEIAFYDSLTGLMNNNYLKEYLPHRIKNCEHDKTAILLLNLTNFNLINLTHGFEYGDAVLRQMVEIYANHLSSKDAMFRLNADQFVIVVNHYADISDLEDLCERILADYHNPKINMYRHEYLSLKIVIYELYNPNISAERVLYDAAFGLGILKNQVSNNYILFTPGMIDTLQRQEAIENALLAITTVGSNGLLYMHYQPLLDIKTNKIVGFEALARMNIPGVGPVPPAEFIPIAERRNLIFALGHSIFEETAKFLQLLKSAKHNGLFVSVNISAQQLLRDEFFNAVTHFAGYSSEDYHHLVFEITESVMVENFVIANKTLQKLRGLGISIALDDFGTGYSSLAELRNMDIDILKIDRIFVDRIDKSELLITQDIIAIAHRLNLKVVAEGVESEKQLQYLAEHNCDIIQGYHISKPLPQAEALKFLEQHDV